MEPDSDRSQSEPVTTTGLAQSTRSTESASFLVPAEAPAARPDPSSYTGPGAAAAGSTKPDITSPAASLGTPFNGALQPAETKAVNQGSLLEEVSASVPDAPNPEPPKPVSRSRIVGLGLLTFGIVAAVLIGLRVELNKSHAQEARFSSPSEQIKPQQLQTTSLSKQLGTAQTTNAVTVNGQLQVTSSLVLQPSTLTGPAVTGQMYYNSATNLLAYYNGKQYVTLQGGGNTYITNVAGNTTNITNITNTSGGGFTGTGTPGVLTLFASSSTLGNSLLVQNGNAVSIGSNSISVGTGSGLATIQGGNGGVSMVTTSNASGSSGDITIQSGASATTASGNVTVDTGTNTINGMQVADYGFETGLEGGFNTGGVGTYTLAQDCTVAHTGGCSMNITGSDFSGGGNWVFAPQQSVTEFPVTPGHHYVFSFWVKAASTSSEVLAQISNDTPCGINAGQFDNSSTWTHMTWNCTVPAGYTHFGFQVGFVAQLSQTHYFDDITATDISSSSSTAALNLGATNAQAVTIGNQNETGATTILGGTGIDINSGLSTLTASGGSVGVTSGSSISLAGGAGNVTITTADATNTSGDIVIESGASSTTAAGNIVVDTGSNFVSGTVAMDYTFEDGVDALVPWTNGTAAQNCTVARTGSCSLAVTGTNFWGIITNGNDATYIVPITAGHHYNVSAWVRAATGSTSLTGALMFNVGNFDTHYLQFPTTNTSTTGWTQMTVTGIAPAGATEGTFRFGGATNATSNGTQYIDDVVVTDLSSGSASSELDLGSSNAQAITIGNMNETEATTIDGGSGITMNAGAANIAINGGAISVNGSGASSIGTNTGSLTLGAGGGAGGGVIVQTQADTTTAFQVQGAGTNLLTVDSTDKTISLGVGGGSALGYAGVGNFAGGGSGINGMYAQKLTTTSAGTVTSMSAYLVSAQGAPNNQFQFAIYSDNSNAPGTYIASSTIGNQTSDGWYTLPITATLTANTTYWLVHWQNSNFNGSNDAFTFISHSGAASYYNQVAWQSGTNNGFPTTFPTTGPNASVGSGALASMYASFASSGPALTLGSTGQLTQSGAALFQDPTDSAASFQIQNSFGNALFTADTADMNITVSKLIVAGDITVNGHIVTGGSTPTIAAGAASCTTPTVAVTGTDTSGTVTITTGSGCSGGGTLATISFSSTYANPPNVTLTPANAAAAGLQYYNGNTAVGSFTVDTNTTPSGATAYKWHYWAAQ